MSYRARTLIARIAGVGGVALSIVAGALLQSAFTQTFAPGLVIALLLVLLAAVGLIVFAASRERSEAARRQAELLAEVQLQSDELARQRDEAKLLESAVVHTRNGVVVLEAQAGRRVLYVNDAYCRMTGYEPGEVVGQAYQSPAEQEVDPAIRDGIREALDAGRLHQVELWSRRKDGTGYWVDLSLVPIPSHDGGVAHWVAVQRDATERKRTEEALRASEVQLRMAGDNIPGGAIYQFVDSPQGERRFTYVSAGVERLFGLTPAEVMADSTAVFRQIHPDDRAGVMTAEAEAHRKQGPFDRELRIIAKNGEVKWIHCRSMPESLPDGSWMRNGVAMDVTVRKQTEDALRTSEERLRLVGDNLPSGAIYHIIANAKAEVEFLYMSAGIEPLLGLKPHEILADADRAHRLVHPDDQARVREAQLASHRNLTPFDIEFRSYSTTGELKWVHCRSMPRRMADGRTDRYGVILDVTARRQAEEARRRSDERNRLIVESSPECVKLLALDGTVLEMNSAGLAMVEADRVEQVIGKCAYPIVAPEYRAAFAAFNERVCRGETGSMEYEIVGLKGTRRHLATHATPLREAGENVAQLAVTRDVTERKRVEEAVRRSEELFRGIFEGTSAGISLTDPNGRFVSCNPAYAAMLGRTVEEVIRLSPEEITVPEDWAAQKPLFKEVRAGTRDRFECTKRYRRPDGSVVWTELSFAAIRGPQGEYQYGLGVTIDVTARRHLEEQLQEARKLEAIGRLAGGVAHDFNNLLTGMVGNLAMVQLPADDPGRPHLAAIDQAATRAADLTRKLLGFARRSQLVPVPIEPKEVFDEVIKTARRVLDSRIRITVGIAPGCGPVLADAALLKQVILDLCLNARDAMPSGGTLTLAAGPVQISANDAAAAPESRPGAYVRLSVADTGSGMSEAVRSQIFEPFFTTKEAGKGNGLGLAMVQGIVKQHGGWVECRSGPGAGTRFDLYLAAVAVPASPSGSRLMHVGNVGDATLVTPAPGEVTLPEVAVPSELGTKTILLVDDEAMIRTLGRVVLERSGFRVLLAQDGTDAVEVFARERGRIDLIVMDMTMPRMSGREAFRKISRLAPGTRVLFSSGYCSEDISDLEGSLGLLSKPYRPSELVAAVREALAASVAAT